jgi:hypothetical protein
LLVKILILGSSNGIPLLNCSGKSRVCSLWSILITRLPKYPFISLNLHLQN